LTVWKIHVRASENPDGTGPDKFYELDRSFTSLRAAKQEARKYRRTDPAWLREVRVYHSVP